MAHKIILHPYVTEKTMNQMSGTKAQDETDGNKLEFAVRMGSTKAEIKKAFEQLFEAEVASVNTKITKDGKRAIIKLKVDKKAEEIGMRIGVF